MKQTYSSVTRFIHESSSRMLLLRMCTMYSVFGPNIIIQMYDINRRIYTLWLQSERQISQGKSNC
ncbi:hypothetical protein EV202_102117 [Bacteroides heparinolyticus]|uniref:Uncharacterized protein n=1 Tax=Prevotella heparinolytica TaxID=28113 RepID=A0A4R2M1I6_9BACE|nr:hypothetical protein EV202_102117 [Bacteroides heparinolyticus]